MADDGTHHVFDENVWTGEYYDNVPVGEYAHTVIELEDEVNRVMIEGCKVDACLDWFIYFLKEIKPDYRQGRSYPINLDEFAGSRLEEIKAELRDNLNRLVPGYLDGVVDVLNTGKLLKRLQKRWDSIPIPTNGETAKQDSVPNELLDVLMDKHYRQRAGYSGPVPPAGSTGTHFIESCRQLKDFIENQRTTASYACGGSISIDETTAPPESYPRASGPINIFWSQENGSSAKKLVLPLNQHNNDASSEALCDMVTSFRPASFGRGDQDVIDPSYRKAGKLDPKNFATSFHPADFGIIAVIEKVLLPSIVSEVKNKLEARKLHAELYKMNVYSGPSGLFRSHVDTPRSDAQIGSLVVCLPACFKGGNLLVRHQGKEVDFDWAPRSATDIQWAAFYSDCEHEIKTITEGDRITLTYNLYVTKSVESVLPSVMDPQSLPLYNWIKDLVSKPGFLDDGGVLGMFCSHAYPHTSDLAKYKLRRGLKGSDVVLYSIFQSLGLHVQVLPVLETSGQYVPENPTLDLTGRVKGRDNWHGYIGEYGGSHFSNNFQPYLARGKRLAVNYSELMPPVSRKEQVADVDQRWKLLMMTRQLLGMDEAMSFAKANNLPYKEDSCLIEEGARIGSYPRPYRTTSWGQDMSMDEVLQHGWHAYRLPGITWLTEPKHEEMAFSQVCYGNEASIGTRYSCAAILAIIPPWEKRDTIRQSQGSNGQ